jgi:signal transduction histidine kinase
MARHRDDRQRRNSNVNALAELGLVSAGIIHEVKNSLQGVANALFLLEQERSLSSEAREQVTIARRELSRAFDVSAQTLALVREEHPVAMSVTDVLEEVLNTYAAKIAYKQMTVQKRYEFTGEIQSNPGAIRHVFANIVVNALESAPSETGKLVIHTSASCECKGRKTPGVQIDFVDNGPGIPEKDKKRIFDPLFSTKTGKGSGLGLWVTRRLVLKQNGRIRLLGSGEGINSGTCFSVFLPRVPRLGGRTSKQCPSCGPKPRAQGELNTGQLQSVSHRDRRAA